jgi:ethanolamine-phosphate cytidylyltransferase
MLLCTKTHFIKSLEGMLSGEEGPGNTEERKQRGKEMKQRIRDYASDESGLLPGPVVMIWDADKLPVRANAEKDVGSFSTMIDGKPPRPGQRIIYVDGGFDLFSSGHIEFLRQVAKKEDELGSKSGWFQKAASQTRIETLGEDYGPAYIVAGIHNDEVINYWKGVNYPIMNIFERGLCVLQCRVSPPPLSLFYKLAGSSVLCSTSVA